MEEAENIFKVKHLYTIVEPYVITHCPALFLAFSSYIINNLILHATAWCPKKCLGNPVFTSYVCDYFCEFNWNTIIRSSKFAMLMSWSTSSCIMASPTPRTISISPWTSFEPIKFSWLVPARFLDLIAYPTFY